MKYKFLYTFIFIIVLSCTLIFIMIPKHNEVLLISDHVNVHKSLIVKQTITEKHPLIQQQNALWKYMNEDINTFVKKYGKPERKDKSSFEYEWWIYHIDKSYIKLAVKKNTIVSMYSNRSALNFSPLSIGQDVEKIKDIYTFSDEIKYDNIMFKLSKKDIETRPLISLTNHIYAQLYLDSFTNKLAGVRFVNKETLELIKPYELYYTGDIREVTDPNDEEWRVIENGIEKQILELTNELRIEHDLSTLKWEKHAAKAAKLHSQDMYKENYFSHFSLNGNGLKERLLESNAYYQTAGENIAAQYLDAIAVMHGWLNSEGHRESLFKKEYTHLGVGVYQSYYTQDFLKK